MRQFFYGIIAGLLISATCGITVYLGIIVPNAKRESARIKSESEKRIDDIIIASRLEIDATRDALNRAESTNRELTKRIDELTKYIDASTALAQSIATGIDGDIGATNEIRKTIRQAIDLLE